MRFPCHGKWCRGRLVAAPLAEKLTQNCANRFGKNVDNLVKL